MSATMEQVACVLAEIKAECPAQVSVVSASFSVSEGQMIARVSLADRNVFAPRGGWGDPIHIDHDDIEILGATLRFRAPLTDDPVALCERALAFVRTEASVSA